MFKPAEEAKKYAQNVLKSSGYIADKTMEGVNQDLYKWVKENVRFIKDTYEDVKEFKNDLKDKLANIFSSGSLIRDVKKNALSDLRSGKFYNEERSSEAEKSAIKSAMGADLEFDFDMSEDFNAEEDDEESSEDSKSEEGGEESLTTIADKITSSQEKSSLTAAVMINKRASKNTLVSIAHSEKMFGVMNGSLAAINSSIMKFHQDLAQPLNTYMQNVTSFTQTATSELAKQTSYLENITRLLQERFSNRNNERQSENKLESIFYGGLPSLRDWFDSAKAKFKEESPFDFITPEQIKAFASAYLSSPIAAVLSYGLSYQINHNAIGQSLKRLKKTLSRDLMQAAFNIHNLSKKDSMFSSIARYFDIIPRENVKIDLSQYNKDKADWDGKDKKALQYVIPQQLSAILSILSGREPQMFNYETGKWEFQSDTIQKHLATRKELIKTNTIDRMKQLTSRQLNIGLLNEYNDQITNRDRILMYDPGALADGYGELWYGGPLPATPPTPRYKKAYSEYQDDFVIMSEEECLKEVLLLLADNNKKLDDFESVEKLVEYIDKKGLLSSSNGRPARIPNIYILVLALKKLYENSEIGKFLYTNFNSDIITTKLSLNRMNKNIPNHIMQTSLNELNSGTMLSDFRNNMRELLESSQNNLFNILNTPDEHQNTLFNYLYDISSNISELRDWAEINYTISLPSSIAGEILYRGHYINRIELARRRAADLARRLDSESNLNLNPRIPSPRIFPMHNNNQNNTEIQNQTNNRRDIGIRQNNIEPIQTEDETRREFINYYNTFIERRNRGSSIQERPITENDITPDNHDLYKDYLYFRDQFPRIRRNNDFQLRASLNNEKLNTTINPTRWTEFLAESVDMRAHRANNRNNNIGQLTENENLPLTDIIRLSPDELVHRINLFREEGTNQDENKDTIERAKSRSDREILQIDEKFDPNANFISKFINQLGDTFSRLIYGETWKNFEKEYDSDRNIFKALTHFPEWVEEMQDKLYKQIEEWKEKWFEADEGKVYKDFIKRSISYLWRSPLNYIRSLGEKSYEFISGETAPDWLKERWSDVSPWEKIQEDNEGPGLPPEIEQAPQEIENDAERQERENINSEIKQTVISNGQNLLNRLYDLNSILNDTDLRSTVDTEDITRYRRELQNFFEQNAEFIDDDIISRFRALQKQRKGSRRSKASRRSNIGRMDELFNLLLQYTTRSPEQTEEGSPTAASGGIVKKSGMVSLSEGEVVLPASMNPYYHGNLSDSERRRQENVNLSNWRKSKESLFGGYSKTDKEKSDSETDTNTKTIQKAADKVQQAADNIVEKTEVLVGNAKSKKTLEKSIKDIVKDRWPEMAASGTIGAIIGGAATGSPLGLIGGLLVGAGTDFVAANSNVQEVLFGTYDEKNKTYLDNGILPPSWSNFIKKRLSGTVSAGLAGGIIGALGGPGGIFGGMAIGAGLHLLGSSDTVKDWLLGKADEKGNRKGGAIPDEWRKTLKNKLRKMALPAGIGAGLGLFGFAPWGIFGGMAIGAGLGLLHSSDKMQDYLYGEEDKDGNRTGGLVGKIGEKVLTPLKNFALELPTRLNDFFKHKVFSPLKSIVQSTFDISKYVKREIFGDKGVDGVTRGGFIDLFKSNIVQPLAELINPLKKWTISFGKALYNGFLGKEGLLGIAYTILNESRKYVKNFILKNIMTPLGKLGKEIMYDIFGGVKRTVSQLLEIPRIPWLAKAGEWAANTQIGKIASSIIHPATAIKERFDRTALIRGYSELDAQDRLKIFDNMSEKDQKRFAQLRNYTQLLTKGNSDQIKALHGLLSGNSDMEHNKALDALGNELQGAIAGTIDYNDPHRTGLVKDITTELNNLKYGGDFDENKIKALLNKYPEMFTDDQRRLLNKKIDEYEQKITNKKTEYSENTEKLIAELKKEGVDINELAKDPRLKDNIEYQAKLDFKNLNMAKQKREQSLKETREEKPEIDEQLNLAEAQVEESKKHTGLLEKIGNLLTTVLTVGGRLQMQIGSDENNEWRNLDTNTKLEKMGITDNETKKRVDSLLKATDTKNKDTESDKGVDIDKLAKDPKLKDNLEYQAKSDINSNKGITIDDLATINKNKTESTFDNTMSNLSDKEKSDVASLFNAVSESVKAGKRASLSLFAKSPAEKVLPSSTEPPKTEGKGSLLIGGRAGLGDQFAVPVDEENPNRKTILTNGKSAEYEKVNGEWKLDTTDKDSKELEESEQKQDDTNDYILHQLAKDIAKENKEAEVGVENTEEDNKGKKKKSFMDLFSGGLLPNLLKFGLPLLLGIFGFNYFKKNGFGDNEFINNSLIRMGRNAITGLTPSGMKNMERVHKGIKGIGKVVGYIPGIGKIAKGAINAYAGTMMAGSKLGTSALNALNLGKAATEVTENVATNAIEKTTEKVATTAAGVTEKATAGVAKNATEDAVGIIAKLKNKISSLLSLVGKVCKFPVLVDKVANSKVVNTFVNVIIKKGGAKLLKAAGKMLPVINVAFISKAVIDGFTDFKAKIILGIIDTPTLGQKVLAAIINGLNEAIPFIGGIIPTEYMVDVLYPLLQQWIDPEGKLATQRENAKSVLDGNNEEGVKYKNVEEYLRKHNEGPWTEKAWNWTKETTSKVWNKTKEFASKAIEDFKNDPLGTLYKYSPMGLVTSATDKLFGDNKVYKTGKAIATDIFSPKAQWNRLKAITSSIVTGERLELDKMYSKETIEMGKKIVNYFQNMTEQMPDILGLVTDLWSLSDPFNKNTSISKIVSKYSKNTNFIGKSVIWMISGVMSLINTVVMPFRFIPGLIGKITGPKESKEKAKDLKRSRKSIGEMMHNIVAHPIRSVGEMWNGTFTEKEESENEDSSKKEESESTETEETNSGSGSEVNMSAHTVQKGNFSKFGNSTIDKSGCGPAAASTMLKLYGKNANMGKVANYLEENNYVAGGSKPVGTTIEGISNAISAGGVPTKVTYDKNEIKKSINRGNPTVLLGKDASNRSKEYGGFGPGPHFLTVHKGVTYDSEQSAPRIYNSSINNKNINHAYGAVVPVGGESEIPDLPGLAIKGILSTIDASSLGPAGKLLQFIFGTSGSKTENGSSNGISLDGTMGQPFEIITSVEDLDKYENIAKLYTPEDKYGGKGHSYAGYPLHKKYKALANCSGYAEGRFNHIYNILMNKSSDNFEYPFRGNAADFYNCGELDSNTKTKYSFPPDGKDKYNNIQKLKLTTSPSVPLPGSIMVWAGGSKDAGHVAIVEKVISDTEVLTSESGYGYDPPVYNRQRVKGKDGNWGALPNYIFLGFIYNPGVIKWFETHKDTKINDTELKRYVWSYIKDNIISPCNNDEESCKRWTAAIMGNIQIESQFNVNAEGDTHLEKHSYGLCQWREKRAEDMMERVKENNGNKLLGQLAFLKEETHNGYTGLIAKKNVSVDEATKQWMENYEKPSEDPNINKLSERQQWAHKYYDQFKDLKDSKSLYNIKDIKESADGGGRDTSSESTDSKQQKTRRIYISRDGGKKYNWEDVTEDEYKELIKNKTKDKISITQEKKIGSGSNLWSNNSTITRRTGIPYSSYSAGDSELLDHLNNFEKKQKSKSSSIKSINFTDEKTYKKPAYSPKRKQQQKYTYDYEDIGLGSSVGTQTTPQYSSVISKTVKNFKDRIPNNNISSYDDMKHIIYYLDIIANNTQHNAKFPEIVDVLKESMETMSEINKLSAMRSAYGSSPDMSVFMENEKNQQDIAARIKQIMNKLHAIASAV